MFFYKIEAITLAILAFSLSLSAEDTGHSGQDFAPSASPDGKQIVYYAYRGQSGDLPDLYIVDRKTGIERRVTDTPGMFEIEPQWTPDGSRVAFMGGPSMKELAMYTINPDGSDYRLYYDGDGFGPPNWSPDGTQMVFWLKHESGGSDLLIQNFESGAQTLLEIEMGGDNSSPTWSSDGKQIAFSHRDINNEGKTDDITRDADGIYLINLQSHAVSKLSDKPAIAYSLEWAPDGGHIYYMGPAVDGVMHIHRIPGHGGPAIQVTADTNGPAYFPAFADNGRTLVFSARLNENATRIMTMPIGQVGINGRPTTLDFAN